MVRTLSGSGKGEGGEEKRKKGRKRADRGKASQTRKQGPLHERVKAFL